MASINGDVSAHDTFHSGEYSARLACIRRFRETKIPKSYAKALRRTFASADKQILAQSVLKIEGTARPADVRTFECLCCAWSFIKALVANYPLRNYTVGRFQIGVIPSLRWTNTPINPINYLKRVAFLNTAEGSTRVFRIALRNARFKRLDRPNLIAFARHYNGRPKNKPGAFDYHELLQILCEYQRPVGQGLALHRCLAIDSKCEMRLQRIRTMVREGEDLECVILLASTSAKRVVHSKCFSNYPRPHPVLDLPRMVGSTLKIALYSAYIKATGANPEDIVEDSPMDVVWRGRTHSPRNADGNFRGLVSLEYAFANSINVPAVRLVTAIGVAQFSRYLRTCGIMRPLPDSPLLALGPISLTGIELLATLTPIVTGGFLCWPKAGETEEYPDAPENDGEQVVSTEVCAKMRKLLLSTAHFGTGHFLKDSDAVGLGGKTGTSEGSKDFWFVGAVDEEIYGLVWLGFRDGRSITALDGVEASASRFAVPLWADVLIAYRSSLC